jgi:hypothetical protein
MKKNIMYDLAHKETDVFKQMIDKYTCFEGGLQTTGRLSLLTPWNPTPLSEICLLRIQAYS